MNNNKRNIIKWVIIILLILTVVGIFVQRNFFYNTAFAIKDTNQFQTALVENAKKEDDEYFIKNIYIDNDRTVTLTFNKELPVEGALKGHSKVKFENWTRFETFFSGKRGSNYEIGSELAKIINNPKITAKSTWNDLIESALTNTKLGQKGIWQESPAFDKVPWWRSVLFSLLPVILLGLLMYWLYRKQMNIVSGPGTPSSNKAVRVKSDKKFSDVAGNDEAKVEVEELVDYLKNPKKYAAAGARIPKGILLGGPPGTGKTLLAKATAGEASVPFFFIAASNFVEMFVGLGAKRVRDMFAVARKESPAIIFIDELDAIGRRRGSGLGGGNDEREQTLNQILVEMDGIQENSGILIMAATNRTDILDPALLRPGRFDRTINFTLPDIKAREEILRLHAKGKRISPEIKFDNVAKRTPGYSGAQLENVINEAAILSVREKTNVITSSQIDEAIDRVMSGPAKKNRVITKEELEMVAYHEAGHAVVGIKVPGANKVQKITIIPRGNAGGYNLMLPDKEKYNATKSELLAMIASFMGGRAAEEIIYGKENISTGAGNDIEKATSIARKMVTQYGMSSLGPIKYEEDSENPFLGRDYAKSNSLSSKIAIEIDEEVRKIILEAQELAIKTINENRELHELIKVALLEKETIVKEEIDYIATHLKLPPKVDKKAETAKEYSFEELVSEIEAESKESYNQNVVIKQPTITKEN
ncbi:ATP-dependent zinc metalloprotease FtsH [Mycoplasma phocimorsus]|uniref:ATP-dependent zinc metalloprotease FtsH n=1 Tax=Mycoplasma phocimorsus TaxID=3045839 RepID=UPI0024BFDE1E|nr:ATP-dependent zinc metalloprotease FtsH [Mycoplasma phocimorsus]MDJ1647650.1 ATP-dependent zinc metalloprotease FtsH [Mycoplasma phocimorsus]